VWDRYQANLVRAKRSELIQSFSTCELNRVKFINFPTGAFFFRKKDMLFPPKRLICDAMIFNEKKMYDLYLFITDRFLDIINNFSLLHHFYL